MLSGAIEEREQASLRTVIERIGGWPAIDRHWSSGQFDLTTTLSRIRHIFQYTPMMIIYVGPDERNSTRSRIIVSQSRVMCGVIVSDFSLFGMKPTWLCH